MTQSIQATQFENGQVIERPNMYNNAEGLLNSMNWDSGKKSALFFFSVGRTSGEGDNKKTTWTKLTARFWGRNAQFLESILNHKNAEKEAGRKFTALINMNTRVASWERPTGETWGDDNRPVTETVTYFEGKDPMLMNPSSYEVIAQGRFHQTPEELAQQQKQA